MAFFKFAMGTRKQQKKIVKGLHSPGFKKRMSVFRLRKWPFLKFAMGTRKQQKSL